MGPRRALLVSVLALALVLACSVVALAASLALPTSSAAPAPLAAPASETALISANGQAVVNSPNADFLLAPQSLNVTAQSKATLADIDTAIAEMQQRLLAIKGALEKAGVPAAGIHFQGLNVSPVFAPPQPGQPSPVEKGQPLPTQVTSFTIYGSLQADVPDLKTLIQAMNAATANGATQVNTGGGKGGPMTNTQPPADLLAKGVADAIANARVTAQALATASGKKLGEIHSISANQIYPACCPPGQSGWTIQLTVSFAIQ